MFTMQTQKHQQICSLWLRGLPASCQILLRHRFHLPDLLVYGNGLQALMSADA